MKMHLLLASLSLCSMVSSASATSFNIRPFSEFTQSAPNIIRGKLNSIRTENGVTADGGKTIYTFANLEISDVIKGNISGTQITVRKLGGSKDGLTLDIPSSVEFSEKEEGVFFLSSEREDHSYEVTGMELGKFRIEERNGEEILAGGLFGYVQSHSHDSSPPIAENLKPWSISQLKELVQTQAAAPPGRIQQSKPTPNLNKTTDISNPSAPKTSQAPSTIQPESEQDFPSPAEKENSPLYFEPAFWYSLAFITMTLGVFYYVRRKRG